MGPLYERQIPKEMLYTKMEGKLPRGKPQTRWTDEIRKYIQMRGENWEEIQENRKLENRDGWRFLYNSRPTSLDTTKEC